MEKINFDDMFEVFCGRTPNVVASPATLPETAGIEIEDRTESQTQESEESADRPETQTQTRDESTIEPVEALDAPAELSAPPAPSDPQKRQRGLRDLLPADFLAGLLSRLDEALESDDPKARIREIREVLITEFEGQPDRPEPGETHEQLADLCEGLVQSIGMMDELLNDVPQSSSPDVAPARAVEPSEADVRGLMECLELRAFHAGAGHVEFRDAATISRVARRHWEIPGPVGWRWWPSAQHGGGIPPDSLARVNLVLSTGARAVKALCEIRGDQASPAPVGSVAPPVPAGPKLKAPAQIVAIYRSNKDKLVHAFEKAQRGTGSIGECEMFLHIVTAMEQVYDLASI